MCGRLDFFGLLGEFGDSVEECFEPRPEAILLAVSGGVDSMALAYIGQIWCQENNVKLHAVTIDHNLRQDSGAEAQAVQLHPHGAGLLADFRGHLLHRQAILVAQIHKGLIGLG